MATNGSYQNNGLSGSSDEYQEITGTGSNNGSSTKSLGKMLVVGALVAVAIGIYYGATSIKHGKASHNVQKAMSVDSNVVVKANGKLRLFDELSTFEIDRCARLMIST
jgi:hypothetical protein